MGIVNIFFCLTTFSFAWVEIHANLYIPKGNWIVITMGSWQQLDRDNNEIVVRLGRNSEYILLLLGYERKPSSALLEHGGKPETSFTFAMI
jgi:hypothetical protein